MPVIEINEKLTEIIRRRSIELVTQEEGLVTSSVTVKDQNGQIEYAG